MATKARGSSSRATMPPRQTEATMAAANQFSSHKRKTSSKTASKKMLN